MGETVVGGVVGGVHFGRRSTSETVAGGDWVLWNYHGTTMDPIKDRGNQVDGCSPIPGRVACRRRSEFLNLKNISTKKFSKNIFWKNIFWSFKFLWPPPPSFLREIL